MQKLQPYLDQVARWGLVFFVAVLPFFVIPAAWASVAEAKIIFTACVILVVALVWVVARIMEGTFSIPKSPILVAGVLLPIAYMVSAVVSKGSAVSFVSSSTVQDTVVIMTLLYAILLFTALIFDTAERMMSILIRAFFGGALFLIIFQLVRLAFPTSLTLGSVLPGSASSIFGSWHDLGIFLGLVVILATSLWPTDLLAGRMWKSAAALSGLGAFALLLVINSSDVWYALAGFALLFALYRWVVGQGGENVRKRTLVVAPFIALALVAGAAGTWNSIIYNHLPARLQIVQFEVRPSWQGTFSVGEKVFSGGSTRIFGSGPNTFNQEWGRFKPTEVNNTLFWNIDFNSGVGVIPTAFVTLGALGMISWGALILAFLWSLWRFVRMGRSRFAEISIALSAAILYLIVFHIVYVPGFALSALAFFFLGLIVALEHKGSGRAFTMSVRPTDTLSAVFLGALLIGGGLIAYASVSAIRATVSDMFVNRAVVLYNTSGDLLGAVKMVGDALVVFPHNDRAHRAGVEIGLLQLSRLAASGKDDDAARSELQVALSQTIEHGLAAVSINGNDYQNWLALANLYQNLAGAGVEGAYEKAREAYEKARAVNPTNPLPLIGLAQVEMAVGDTTAALQDLDQALALKPDLSAASFLRSQLEASKGDFTAAVRDAAAAIQGVPQDPLGWYNLGAVLYVAGSYHEAVPVLEKAVALQNDYANALFVLALSYEKLGRHAEALVALKSVAERNPNDTTLQRMVKDLEMGRALNLKSPN